MDVISILSLVFGVFGLAAFARVNSLSKQVYLLRSDLRMAEAREQSGGGSCGCGGNC